MIELVSILNVNRRFGVEGCGAKPSPFDRLRVTIV
jgi:hypothetical protein